MNYSPEIEDEIRILAASPQGLQKCAGNLGQYLDDGWWLDRKNAYRQDAVGQIIGECKAGTDLCSEDLCEYVAVSVPLHLAEGWEYLGQALYAQISGKPHVAVHLGYYAELRGAMSLLATQGFGIFNRYHCAIDGIGDAHCLPSKGELGTHDAVWTYLEKWSESAVAGSALGELIRPRGTPLAGWLNELPCTVADGWSPVARSLLEDIGLDLERMRDDRQARNYASYRPWELRDHVDWTITEAVEFVVESIRLIEPSDGGGFDTLDQYILSEVVGRVFLAKTNLDPGVAVERFRSEVSVMVRECVEERLVRDEMESLFFQEPPLLMRMAFDKSDTGDPRPLLARAVLLLRIATSAARSFMNEADIGIDETAFWWQKKGRDLGLWEDQFEREYLGDSWQDVVAALEELDDWRTTAEHSTRGMLSEHAYSLHETTNLGRMAIIGLA